MANEHAPLGIIAAAGELPLQVARSARDSGRDVFIIGLEGLVHQDVAAFEHVTLKWGQIGKLFKLLGERRIADVVIVGAVDRRPDLKEIGFDLGAMRMVPKILKTVRGGDDNALRAVVRLIEDEGHRVLGAHEIVPELVAVPGPVAGPASRVSETDAGAAMSAARAIGELDIGQGAVAVEGRVIALEAAEGTDAMIARVQGLREDGRVRWKGRQGVLAKRSKPQQDLRVDMPTIGPRTVQAVAEAGLAGIVIEAGRVMIADRARTMSVAEASETYILAVDVQDTEIIAG